MISLGKEHKSFYLLSEIDDATLDNVTSGSARVTITASGRNKDGQDVSKILFAESVSPYDSVLTVYDVRTLIKDAMIELKISIATINVSMHTANETFNVLFEDNAINMEAEDIKRDCFLLTDSSKMFYGMPKEDTIFWISSGGTFSAKIVAEFFGEDEPFRVYEKNISFPDGPENTLSFHNFIFDEIVTEARNHFPDIKKMVSLSVISGNKTVQYFIHSDEDSEHRIYYFTNEFNVLEAFDMRGVTTEKTSAKQNTVLCGHSHIAYDHSVEKTYSVQSAAFYVFQQHQVEALISARRFFVPINGKAYECVFTESDSEFDDNPENPYTVEFSFRTVQDAIVKGGVEIPERIFNDIFNFVYG